MPKCTVCCLVIGMNSWTDLSISDHWASVSSVWRYFGNFTLSFDCQSTAVTQTRVCLTLMNRLTNACLHINKSFYIYYHPSCQRWHLLKGNNHLKRESPWNKRIYELLYIMNGVFKIFMTWRIMALMFNVFSGQRFKEVFFYLRKCNYVICERFDVLVTDEILRRFAILTDTWEVYY